MILDILKLTFRDSLHYTIIYLYNIKEFFTRKYRIYIIVYLLLQLEDIFQYNKRIHLSSSFSKKKIEVYIHIISRFKYKCWQYNRSFSWYSGIQYVTDVVSIIIILIPT